MAHTKLLILGYLRGKGCCNQKIKRERGRNQKNVSILKQLCMIPLIKKKKKDKVNIFFVIAVEIKTF